MAVGGGCAPGGDGYAGAGRPVEREAAARYRAVMAPTRKTKDKDVLARLADAGEEALQRLAELPGGKAVVDAMGGVRERLDDVAARLRALDPLERRVSSIERRLDALEKPKAAARTAVRRAKAPARTARTARGGGTRSRPPAA